MLFIDRYVIPLYFVSRINEHSSRCKIQSQICFWATRYDCFADKEEFKLGIETIKRLLPQVEKDLQPDRQIAALFDWNMIEGNANLPFPYIVSFTSRPNNEYMWNEYAKNDGIVMAIDNTQPAKIPDAPLLRLSSCLYVDEDPDEEIVEMIRQEYTKWVMAFLVALIKSLPLDYCRSTLKFLSTL